jgi:phospholipid-binding lipoprotein MlaA
VLDIASEAGIKRRYEDFGQTLGRWGVPSGPYLVLPILGPSTVRDTTASVAYGRATELNPYEYIDNGRSETSLGLQVLRGVDLRADLLSSERLLNELALDKYTFVRDTYLQRRRSVVYDGDPPEDSEPSKPLDKDPPDAAKEKDKDQSAPIAPETPAKPEVAPKSEAVPPLIPDATIVSMPVSAANPSTLELSQELKISHAAPFSTASNKE